MFLISHLHWSSFLYLLQTQISIWRKEAFGKISFGKFFFVKFPFGKMPQKNVMEPPDIFPKNYFLKGPKRNWSRTRGNFLEDFFPIICLFPNIYQSGREEIWNRFSYVTKIFRGRSGGCQKKLSPEKTETFKCISSKNSAGRWVR